MSAANSGHVLVVGSTNADLTVTVERFPGPGETLHASDFAIRPGGKGANQALAAARSGAAVTFVGAVGDDDNGRIALRLLQDAGVDLSKVRHVSDPTGTAHITVDAGGENTIVVAAGANASMDADAVSPLGALTGVVVGQGEIPRSGIEQLVRQVTDGGGRWVLNLAPVIPVDDEVILAADPLVANEHEVLLIAEQLGLSASTGLDAVRALRKAGVRSIVLTLGAAGAVVAYDDVVEEVPAPKVKAVDTTGAGDAFTGALAAALARGEGLPDAARAAARFAAGTVVRPGAQESYPALGEELPNI